MREVCNLIFAAWLILIVNFCDFEKRKTKEIEVLLFNYIISQVNEIVPSPPPGYLVRHYLFWILACSQRKTRKAKERNRILGRFLEK